MGRKRYHRRNISCYLSIVKANNKYMKDYDKNKELLYLRYRDVNNLYGWVVSQKLPVNDFKWVENNYKFDEIFMKSYNEESGKG